MGFEFHSLVTEKSGVAGHPRRLSNLVNPSTLHTVFGSSVNGAREGPGRGEAAIVLPRRRVQFGGRRWDVACEKLHRPKEASSVSEAERVKVAKSCKAFVNRVRARPERPIARAPAKALHGERLTQTAHCMTTPQREKRAPSAHTVMSRCAPRPPGASGHDTGQRRQKALGRCCGRTSQSVVADHAPLILHPTDGDRRASFSIPKGTGVPAAAWSWRLDLPAA
jgi:hypothetical protein